MELVRLQPQNSGMNDCFWVKRKRAEREREKQQGGEEEQEMLIK